MNWTRMKIAPWDTVAKSNSNSLVKILKINTRNTLDTISSLHACVGVSMMQ